MQPYDALLERALTIKADRARLGMPITIIEAVDLATSSPEPDSVSGLNAVAAAAKGLVIERQRIGMPISYVDAVSVVQNRVTAPVQTAMSAASILMPLPDPDTRAEVAVAAAVAAGKVPEDCRGWAMSFATSDINGFQAFAAGTPDLTGGLAGKRPEQIAEDMLKAAQDYQASQAKLGLTIDIIAAATHIESRF